jgi:DNA-binding response OmpR family regulator
MPARKRILLIADEAHLRAALGEHLAAEFETVEAGSAADAVAVGHAGRFDAIVLDASAADGSGAAECRTLRAADADTPILAVVAGSGTADAIQAAGASDSVARPLRLGDLIARLRALLRRRDVADAGFAIGDYVLQPARKALVDTRSGARIRLTDKEAAILRHLHGARGAVVSREDLLAAIWGYNADVNTHTLETHIYRLRRKIERDLATPLLVTGPGGYRLAR